MSMISQQETAGKIEAEAALAGAGLLAAAGAGPLILARGTPWRVIWANEQASRIFGGADLGELTRMLFTGPEPGARQLARLAERMAATAEPADVRLRLRLNNKLEMHSFSCVKLAGEPARFAIAPWGGAALAAAEQARIDNLKAVEADASLRAAGPAGQIQAMAQALVDDGESAPVQPATPALGNHTHVVDRRGNVRFLWRTDRDGKLASITGALCEAVGCDSADLIGRDFRAALGELKVDGDGRLREALSRKDTWSGIEVLWPMAGTMKRVPIVFGALPGFDRTRAFDGFSGFGVIHLDRVHLDHAHPDRMSDAPTATSLAQTAVNDPRTNAAPALASAAVTAAEIPPLPVSDASQQTLDTAPFGKPHESQEIIKGNAISDDDTDELDAELAKRENTAPTPPGRSGEHREDAGSSDTIIPVTEAPAAVLDAPSTEAPAGGLDAIPAGTGKPDADKSNGDNVVPIRAWQKDQRPAQAVTEAPNFVKSASASASRNSDATLGKSVASGVTDTSADPKSPAVASSDIAANGRDELVSLSPAERNAFREIARALSARNNEQAPAASPKRDSDNAARPAFAAEPSVQVNRPAEESPAAGRTATPATARDETSDALRLIERLDAGVLVSRGGVPAFINKTLLDMLGYEGIEEFYKSGGVDRMFRGRSPDALSREAEGGAIPVVASNGDVLALEGRVQAIEWDDEPATLMTFRRTQGPEMAARIRALELDLRQRETEARETHAILDTATDGVALIDEDGRILSLNKSGQALFGYEQNEVAGETFTMLLARESHAPAMDYLNGLKSNGVKSLLNDGREISGRARQGGLIPLFMTLGRVGTSSPQRFCAVLRDLTQWKKVERDLSDAKRDAERASSLKSDFLAKVSHEIRTPLNAILGFAEVIMDERFGPVGNERYKDYLKDIHSSGTHVLSLVNDLLDLSKIEAGKLDLNFGAVNVNRIVNECVSLLQTQATRDRIIIRLSLAPRLPNIVADERSLRQIVINILSNAVKFNEPGGQIIVSTALTDAGHAVIRIRDTGIGMNEKELEMALEPFRQIATSRPTVGTGLGLPLTKALVEANRASFTIKSRKGEGTLVEVSFPQTRVLAE